MRKINSTIKDLASLNQAAYVTLRNAQNYEDVARYFDFQNAVRAILWNQK